MFVEWLLYDFGGWFATGNNALIFWLIAYAVVIGVHLIGNKLHKGQETNDDQMVKVTIVKH